MKDITKGQNMIDKINLIDWLISMPDWPRANLAQLPTPMHRLNNFGKLLGGP